MPSQKRQRQREGREARRQALLAAQRRKKARQRAISIAIIVALIFGFMLLAANRGDDDSTDVASDKTTTTTAPGDEPTTTTAPPPEVKVGSQECPKADGSSPKTTKFDGAFKKCIEDGKTYVAKVVTDVGEFELTLDQVKAPNTVNNFVSLARYHAYDGVPFHRVIKGFMIQGGDVELKSGTGGPGYAFNDELPKAGEYKEGSVAMANSGPHTNGSQFFVITGPEGVSLPPSYNLFGNVTKGMETVKAIEADGASGGDGAGVPQKVHTVTSITITES